MCRKCRSGCSGGGTGGDGRWARDDRPEREKAAFLVICAWLDERVEDENLPVRVRALRMRSSTGGYQHWEIEVDTRGSQFKDQDVPTSGRMVTRNPDGELGHLLDALAERCAEFVSDVVHDARDVSPMRAMPQAAAAAGAA